ncbi:hypothetical protein ACB094_03G129300 [Castanea mollissima]
MVLPWLLIRSVLGFGGCVCLLSMETADCPGLLVDLVKIITDINIAVQSGEFDTEGLLTKAKFHVSYRDKPISKPLQLDIGFIEKTLLKKRKK